VLVLALDTSSRAGSVAVARDGDVLAAITGDGQRTHGERLPLELTRALDAAQAAIDEVTLLAVAVGPGSFTGLRVGIASIQGLAFARGLTIVPVSTLEALAFDAAPATAGEALIAPWVDAQRGEVFAALYAADATHIQVPPTSAPPLVTLEGWQSAIGTRHVLFTGDGAVRYRETIATALGNRASIVEPVPALAAAIARIAMRDTARAVLPHAIVPLYVRRPDAEIARDRQAHARP
jgi:tRNA threonylcarbamoyladenosine biosynthesis protein TsaB